MIEKIKGPDDLKRLFESALSDFQQCVKIAVPDRPPDLRYEFDIRWPPHKRPGRLKGRGAIYTFFWPERNEFLKIGKAGSGSENRYRSHHYNGKAGSTLRADLLKNCNKLGIPCSTEKIEDWMLDNLARADVLFAPGYDDFVLAMLEAFLHLRWRPRFEGSRK